MPTAQRIERITRFVRERQRGVVVLEDIRSLHNAAAAYRACDAFAIQRVDLVFQNERAFNPRSAGRVASASANQWIDFTKHTSIDACYASLRASGHAIVAVTPAADATPIHEFDFTRFQDVALAFGSEHIGLSEGATAGADYRVTIPMRGMVESLNLATTVAICLFELNRQRHAAGIEAFRLPDDQRESLLERLLARRASGNPDPRAMAGQTTDPRGPREKRPRQRRDNR